MARKFSINISSFGKLKQIALVLGCVIVFAACNHDEPNDDILTSNRIVALIHEANAKLLAENELTVSYVEPDYSGTEYIYEVKLEVNLSAKNQLKSIKLIGIYEDFHYYDEITHYACYGKTNEEPEDSLFSEKISTGYWKYYTWDLPNLSDGLVEYLGNWKEQDGQFVADYIYTAIEKKYFVTLDENNKYRKIEVKSASGKSLYTALNLFYDFFLFG